MSKRGPTKRKHDAQMRAFRDSPPMTMDQALASADPVGEINLRLSHKPMEQMSEPEKVLWAVSYFVGDTLNGGLIQTMTNSTGELIDVVGEFANRYGPPDLVEIVAGIHRAFPGGRAPANREERIDFLQPLIENDIDPFDELTTRFYRSESAIREGLLALVQRNRDAFNIDKPIQRGHDL